MVKRFIFFFLTIAIGFVGGWYYSTVVKPVDVVDAAFYQLRQDYKTDFVLMAAEIYNDDHSIYNAMRRLDLLGEASTEGAVVNAIEKANDLGYGAVDIAKMENMYYAIFGGGPTATPIIDLTMAASFAETQTPQAPDTGIDIIQEPNMNPVNPISDESALYAIEEEMIVDEIIVESVPMLNEADPFFGDQFEVDMYEIEEALGL